MAANTNTILSHLVRVLSLLSLYQHRNRAQPVRAASNNYTDHVFQCNATNPCSGTIFCPTNADCTLSCDAIRSCEGGTIQCPLIGSCDVSCNQEYACQNAQFLWTDDQPNSLLCGPYTESCYGVHIKPHDQNVDFTQTCAGDMDNDADRICAYAKIDCPTNANCDINCGGDDRFSGGYDSCQGATIQCPLSGSCNITCGGSSSCFMSTVYCPPNSLCRIECADFSCDYMNVEWSPIVDIGSVICLDPYGFGCEFLPSPPPRSPLLPTSNNTDYVLSCDSALECSRTIFCPSDANCTISCNGHKSCFEAVVYCPLNGACDISCNIDEACYNAFIHWVDDQPNSLFCGVEDRTCSGINFEPYNQNIDFFQDCTGPSREFGICYGSTFHCPSNANCYIKCDGAYACYNSTIYCPSNYGSCNITCGDTYSCAHSHIYAQNASFLYIELIPTSGGSWTTRGLQIWFPPKVGNVPRARLQFYTTYRWQEYYALNGWQDIDIPYAGDYQYHSGTMHCGVGYSDSCAFASNSFSCDASNPICDNPVLTTTAYPSALPTTYPSLWPTTHPSFEPSSSISTGSPTNYPSSAPSNAVTTLPTDSPSKFPSTEVPSSTPSAFLSTTEATTSPATETSGPMVNVTTMNHTEEGTTKDPTADIDTTAVINTTFVTVDEDDDEDGTQLTVSITINSEVINMTTHIVNEMLVAYLDPDVKILSVKMIKDNKISVIISTQLDKDVIEYQVANAFEAKYDDVDVVIEENGDQSEDHDNKEENDIMSFLMAGDFKVFHLILIALSSVIMFVCCFGCACFCFLHKKKNAVTNAESMMRKVASVSAIERDHQSTDQQSTDHIGTDLPDLPAIRHQALGDGELDHNEAQEDVEGGIINTACVSAAEPGKQSADHIDDKRCVDCGEVKAGKYAADGFFYCNDCYVCYEDDENDPNDESHESLYDAEGGNTGGANTAGA